MTIGKLGECVTFTQFVFCELAWNSHSIVFVEWHYNHPILCLLNHITFTFLFDLLPNSAHSSCGWLSIHLLDKIGQNKIKKQNPIPNNACLLNDITFTHLVFFEWLHKFTHNVFVCWIALHRIHPIFKILWMASKSTQFFYVCWIGIKFT
jgi:hypothetical protein